MTKHTKGGYQGGLPAESVGPPPKTPSAASGENPQVAQERPSWTNEPFCADCPDKVEPIPAEATS